MLLSEFAANTTVKNELSETMKNNSLPHAILLTGAKGTGKKTLADMIAQYCVCSSDTARPCGICPDCLKAQKQIHPDIVTADGNNTGALSIDSVRKIRASAYIKPNEAAAKVYLLLNCEKMLPPAQNAFLKILEEPPENVVFIMTAVSASSLLQTVRSRSRIFSLYPAAVSEAVNEVQKRLPEKSADEIKNAAERCGGNIGMILQTLENGGEEAMKLAEEIFSAILLSVEYPLLTLTYRLTQSRNFAVNVADCLIEVSAEAVKASAGVKTSCAAAENAAKKISKKRLIKIQNKAQKAREILNSNVNMNFFCTWLCAALRS